MDACRNSSWASTFKGTHGLIYFSPVPSPLYGFDSSVHWSIAFFTLVQIYNRFTWSQNVYCCFVSLTRLTFKLQDQRQFEVNNVIVLAIERKRIRHFSFTFVFKILSPNLPPSWTVADHISPSLASRLVWTVNSPHLLQILTFIMPSLTSEEITFFVNGKKVGNLSITSLPRSICVCLIPRSSLYTHTRKSRLVK